MMDAGLTFYIFTYRKERQEGRQSRRYARKGKIQKQLLALLDTRQTGNS